MAEFGRSDLSPEIETITPAVIGAASEVHTILGPGLLESVYERSLLDECGRRDLRAQTQVGLVVPYEENQIHGQRADLVVEGVPIVDLKAVSERALYHPNSLSPSRPSRS